MADIVDWGGVTRLCMPADKVVAKAAEAELKDVVIVGWGEDGEFYFVSSMADGGDVLWLLEVARKKLLEAGGA